ncbi:MAG: choice-of-anchor X domain-containing protein [Thermoanaerobaculia bacterium]
MRYVDPVALGRPFKIGTKWEYTRITDGNSYTHEVEETNENIHVLSEYDIKAADVVRVYKREPWIVRAQFRAANGETIRGGELFVQCFLIGPDGRFRSFVLQDDGMQPDDKPNDGIYTGVYQFALEKNPVGLWRYFVIAQDVNNADPNLKPEEAAQIIGGFVVTHQLTIDFDPTSDCPFVPDGHVNVI